MFNKEESSGDPSHNFHNSSDPIDSSAEETTKAAISLTPSTSPSSAPSNRWMNWKGSNGPRIAELMKRILPVVVAGQVLSLLVSWTGVASQELAERGVAVPTSQAFANYALLALVYSPLFWLTEASDPERPLRWRWRAGGGLKAWSDAFWQRGWAYALVALVDVEANYLVVLAYQYTSITSVMLLDCFSIPAVVILARFFLGTRIRPLGGLGAAIALSGLIGLVLSDWESDSSHSALDSVLGDGLCLAGTFLYAVSNVAQEGLVHRVHYVEFLAFLGLFGAAFGGLQSLLLEGGLWLDIPWAVWQVPASFALFALALFWMYSLVPLVLLFSGATLLNLSLLTSDIYAVVWAYVFFSSSPSPWYFLAYVVIVFGVLLYNLSQSLHVPNPSSLESSSNLLPIAMSDDGTDQPCVLSYSNSFNSNSPSSRGSTPQSKSNSSLSLYSSSS